MNRRLVYKIIVLSIDGAVYVRLLVDNAIVNHDWRRNITAVDRVCYDYRFVSSSLTPPNITYSSSYIIVNITSSQSASLRWNWLRISISIRNDAVAYLTSALLLLVDNRFLIVISCFVAISTLVALA